MARDAGVRRQAAQALDGLGDGWVVVHDIRWPGRRTTDADHLVAGPCGVFVVTVSSTSAARRQDAARAVDAAVSVAHLLGLPTDEVHPVLCVAGEPAAGPAGRAGSVVLCAPGSLARVLAAEPERLSTEQVQDLAARLAHQTRRATGGGLRAPEHRGVTDLPSRVARRQEHDAARQRAARLRTRVVLLAVAVLLGVPALLAAADALGS